MTIDISDVVRLISSADFDEALKILQTDQLQSGIKSVLISRIYLEKNELDNAELLISDFTNTISRFCSPIETIGMTVNKAILLWKKRKIDELEHILGMLENQIKTIEIDEISLVDEWEASLFSLKGKLHNHLGHYSVSQQNHRQALHIREQQQLPLRIAMTKNDIGITYFMKDDFDEAKKYYSSSLNILDSILSPNKKVKDFKSRVKSNLGLIYLKKGKLQRAEPYLLESLKHSTINNDKKEILRSYQNLASLYNYMGNNDEAISYHSRILELAEEMGEFDILAASNYGMGNICYLKGELDESLKYYKDSMKFAQKTKNQLLLAYILTGLGVIYTLKSNYSSAIDLFRKVEEYNKTLQYPNLMARPFFFMSLIYLANNELDLAKEYGLESYNMYKNTKNVLFISSSLTNLVQISLNRQNLEEAKHYLDMIETIFAEHKKTIFVELNYKLARGLVLKNSGDDDDLGKALHLLEDVANQRTIYHNSAVIAMFNLCEIHLIQIYNLQTLENYHKVEILSDKLYQIGLSNNRHDVLIDSLILKSKLKLITFDLPSANEILSSAIDYCKNRDLALLLKSAKKEYLDVSNGQSKWIELQQNNAGIQQRILKSKIVRFTRTKGSSRGISPKF